AAGACGGGRSAGRGPRGGAGVRASGGGGAGPAPAAPQAGGGSAPGRNAPPAGNASARMAPARALVRTADLTVAVRDVVAQSRRAVVIATEAGGDMYGEQLNTGTTPAESTADLTFKVPPDSLDTVLDRLARLGDQASRHARTAHLTHPPAHPAPPPA